MSPLFSIIIPVYNAEEYIRKCLDSVLNQGLDDYEVLLVNDGSKDGSVGICEEYCRKNPHFRLLHQENAGVSAARNHGIEEARGRYIVFVDADDYLLDGGMAIAFRCLKDRGDIDVVNYVSSYDFWPKKPVDESIALDGTGHEFLLMRGIVSFCWLFAYSKSFLDEHHIRFSPYIVGEDQLFTATVLLANPRIVATNADIYRYVVHESSATTKRDREHARRSVEDYLSSYADIIAQIRLNHVEEKPEVYKKCVEEMNFKKMFGFSRMLTSRYGRHDYCRIMERCKQTGFYPVLPVPAENRKVQLRAKLMNLVMRHYAIYRCAAWAFNSIVEPYVLRRIRTRL